MTHYAQWAPLVDIPYKGEIPPWSAAIELPNGIMDDYPHTRHPTIVEHVDLEARLSGPVIIRVTTPTALMPIEYLIAEDNRFVRSCQVFNREWSRGVEQYVRFTLEMVPALTAIDAAEILYNRKSSRPVDVTKPPPQNQEGVQSLEALIFALTRGKMDLRTLASFTTLLATAESPVSLWLSARFASDIGTRSRCLFRFYQASLAWYPSALEWRVVYEDALVFQRMAYTAYFKRRLL